MKRILLLIAAVAVVALSASATPVTYNTLNSTVACNGVGGCVADNTHQVTVGGATGVTINFVGLSANTVNLGPPAFTFASLGDVFLSCASGGTGCATQDISGLTIDIVVQQTAPFPGGPTGIPSGTFAGSFLGTSSSAMITWPVPNAIGFNSGPVTVTYSIANNPAFLAPPSTNGGDTTIQGRIDYQDLTVPEPATLFLMGAGLLGLGVMRRRS